MEQPSSPVEIGETIESLLLFTLHSHLKEQFHPKFDLDLTREFCHHLLEKELYKLLARALSEKMFLGLGHDLLNMLKKVNFELHVQEPYFTQLKDGLKTVEGRCAVGDYKSSGAFVLFNKCLLLEVQDVRCYKSFSEMLTTEGLSKVLPGVESIEEGVQVYRNFYSEEKEKTNGVIAIHVAKPADQPYTALARVLSELKSTGIKSLLDDYTARVTP